MKGDVMAVPFGTRMKCVWNAFLNRDPTDEIPSFYISGSSYRPDRPRFTGGHERSIANFRIQQNRARYGLNTHHFTKEDVSLLKL